MQSRFKLYFTDPATGAPRWGMTLLVYGLIFLVVAIAVPKIRALSKKPKTTEGGDGIGDWTSTDTPPTGGDVQPSSFGPWVQEYAVNLQRVNTKTYWMACYGSGDPNERCEWWQKFLDLTEEGQKAVALTYQSRFGKLLRDDIDAVWGCDCSDWDETKKMKILKQLWKLGV